MFDRRETTLAFRVEDDELQALSALLNEIAQRMASLGGATGGGGFTPNYAGGGGPMPNVAPPGGGINPAATGSAGPTGTAAQTTPIPNASPVLGGGLNGGVGSLTIVAHGQVVVNAYGAVTFNGSLAGGGGGGGGAAPPGAPTAPGGGGGGGGSNANVAPPGGGVSPAATGGGSPYARGLHARAGGLMFDDLQDGNSLDAGFRMMLGGVMGDPRQFLGYGDPAIQAASRYYLGAEAGHLATFAAQPFLSEARMYHRGVRMIAPEDVAATRWSNWSRVAGGVAGGALGLGVSAITGGLVNPAFSVGAGTALGSSMIGTLGDFMSEDFMRSKDVRMVTQPFESALGMPGGSLKDSFQRLTPSGRMVDFAREAGLIPDWVPTGWLPASTGQYRDELTASTVRSMGMYAPNSLYNISHLREVKGIHDRLREGFEPAMSGFMGAAAGEPLLAPFLQSLNSPTAGQLGISGFARSLAPILGASGNLSGGFAAAQVGGGGYGDVTRHFYQMMGVRGAFGASQAGFGVAQAEAGLQSQMGFGVAAGEALMGGAGAAGGMASAAGQEAAYWRQLASTELDPNIRAMAEMKANEAQARATQSFANLAGLPVRAAQERFGETFTVAQSRTQQGQTRLASASLTSFYGPRMEEAYSAIAEGIGEQIDSVTQLLRSMKQSGMGPKALAPLYAQIRQLEHEQESLAVAQWERAYGDSRAPAQAGMQIAGAQLRGIAGRGDLYGPAMAGAFSMQTAGQGALVASFRNQYEDAVRRFGPNSPQALTALTSFEDAASNLANLPFQQHDMIFGGFQSVAGATTGALGGMAGLTLGAGYGSRAAFGMMQSQATSAAGEVEIARARLTESRRLGAGPERIAQDQAALVGAQQRSLAIRQSMTQVDMGSAYNIEHMEAGGRLRRMQMSWTEPGNMLDEYARLHRHAGERLKAIDEQEAMLSQSGPLTPKMREMFARQREEARMEQFGYQVQMEEGWLDRLTSMSLSAPSFYGRARPTMAQGAGQLEERGMQHRAFGFVSRRGYEHERARGFMTAGSSSLELFPGDLALQALGGRRKFFGEGAPGGDIPGEGTDASGDGASEATAQQMLTVLNSILQELKSGRMHQGGGAANYGQLGQGAQVIQRMLQPDIGDVYTGAR